MKATWIQNSRIEMEGEDFFGGRNRMSNVLVTWGIGGVYGEENRVNLMVLNSRLRSYGIKIEMIDKIQIAKALKEN